MGQITSSTKQKISSSAKAKSTSDSAVRKFPLGTLPMELLVLVFRRLDYVSLMTLVDTMKMDYTGAVQCLTDDFEDLRTIKAVKTVHLSNVTSPMKPVLVTAIHLTKKSHQWLASSLQYIVTDSYVIGFAMSGTDARSVHEEIPMYTPYYHTTISPMFAILSSSSMLQSLTLSLTGSRIVSIRGPVLYPSVIHLNDVHELFIYDFETPQKVSLQGTVRHLIFHSVDPSARARIDFSGLQCDRVSLERLMDSFENISLSSRMVSSGQFDSIRKISNCTFKDTKVLSVNLREGNVPAVLEDIVAPSLETLDVKIITDIPIIRSIHTPILQSVIFKAGVPKGQYMENHLLNTATDNDYTFLDTVTDMTLWGFYDPLFHISSTARLKSLSLLVLESLPWLSDLNFPELVDLKVELGAFANRMPHVNAENLEKLTIKLSARSTCALGTLDVMACGYLFLLELTVKISSTMRSVKYALDRTLMLRATQLQVLSLAYTDVDLLQTGFELPELRSLSVEHDAGPSYASIKEPRKDLVGCFRLNVKADKLESLRIHAHGMSVENIQGFPNLKRSMIIADDRSALFSNKVSGGSDLPVSQLKCSYWALSREVSPETPRMVCPHRWSTRSLDELPWRERHPSSASESLRPDFGTLSDCGV